MYKPKLKYIFCLMRKRSLMPAMSVMRYMNSVGIIPQLLINGREFGEDQHLLVMEELNRYKVKYNEIKNLPDYDIMFFEGPGHCQFERYWMAESRKRNKTNIMLINSLSGWRNLLVPSFLPERTKLLNGICMKMEEHIFHYKEFTKNLFLVNVGDPDWDWWQTEEFKDGVDKARLEFGSKLLVLGETFIFPEQAIPYTEFCIKQAKRLGFKFIINPHPDRWNLMPKQFYKYCNKGIHHHILFKAASHIISSINCSILTEGLFLGTKAGCDPLVPHCDGWGKHRWLDRDSWFTKVSNHIKQEILDMFSPVFNEKDLCNFLSSKRRIPVESAEKAFGKISVPCYTEYLFETLDKRFKNEN